MFAFLQREKHNTLLQTRQGRFIPSVKYIKKNIQTKKIKCLNLVLHEVHVSRGFPGREDGLKMIRPVSCLNTGGQLARNEGNRPNIQDPAKEKKGKKKCSHLSVRHIRLKVQSVIFLSATRLELII